MKIIHNKRGFDYMVYLVIITFISLMLLIVILYQKSGASKTIIGDESQAILELKSESQKINLFIEQSAKYSALKAIDKMAENNNYLETNFYQRYYNILNTELNQYLILFNNTQLFEDNYEFLIINKTIKGIAIQNIKLEKDIKGQKIEYYFRPSFVVEIDPQIEKYYELQNIVQQISRSCSQKFSTQQEIKTCAEIIGKEIQISSQNQLYTFRTPINITNPYDVKERFITFQTILKINETET